MSVMHADRCFARRTAMQLGAFWLPCPSCGQQFGGHEWTSINGHEASIPKEVRRTSDGLTVSVTSAGICPDCTAKGVGCIAHKAAGAYVHECEFVGDQ